MRSQIIKSLKCKGHSLYVLLYIFLEGLRCDNVIQLIYELVYKSDTGYFLVAQYYATVFDHSMAE